MEIGARRFTQHTASRIIRTVLARGKWSGMRRGLVIVIRLSPQLEIDGRRIFWRAYMLNRSDSTNHTGRTGTVLEALEQIEEAFATRPKSFKVDP